MKNILFVLLIVMPMTLNAQFSLTINGFVSEDDNAKDYVVYNFDEVNKETLYTNVLKYITATYNSAKDVVSKVDNEVITINAFQPNAVTAKTLKYDVSYTIIISFKDDKIKIDAPTFKCTTIAYNKKYRLTMSGSNSGFGSEVTVGLFKKDGTPSQKNTIKELNGFFNGFVSEIKQAASGNSKNDDW